jgi:hypothetical protein
VNVVTHYSLLMASGEILHELAGLVCIHTRVLGREEGAMRCKSRLYPILSATLAIAVGVPLRPTVVQGHSMEPTMRAGLYVLNTGYYRLHSLEKGDVVVFRYLGETCTKRIYALSGERVLLLKDEDGLGDEIVEPGESAGLRGRLKSGGGG